MKHNFETRWIGWAGVSVKNETGRASLTEALATKVGVHNLPFDNVGVVFVAHILWIGLETCAQPSG